MTIIKLRLLLLHLLILPLLSFAQPKLVVGIVVDQMRYEYLTRFASNYGNDGFKRLMKEGSNFTYAHYNYVPTYTAPGHASIYTGTTPFYHGITGNDLYDPLTKEKSGSVEDKRYHNLSGEGGVSPHNLLSTTITDELKKSNNGLSKVFSVSIKDRGAVIPGGKLADGVYFYNHDNGEFTTSNYYMDALPDWVVKFNNKKLSTKYSGEEWNLSFPLEKYKTSFPDDAPYEPDLFNEGRRSFPHSLKNVPEKDKHGMLISTPFGNQLLTDLVVDLLDNEKPGSGDAADFLCVSYSTPDYVGHIFGPSSVELHDVYVKLDLEIARLLKELDARYGKGGYLLFLSSDHGVADMQGFLDQPHEYFIYDSIKTVLKDFTRKNYDNEDIFSSFFNRQIYLDHKKIKKMKLDAASVRNEIAGFIRENFKTVLTIATRDDFNGKVSSRNEPNPLLNGFNPVRSGDIFIELAPDYYWRQNQAEAMHGTSFSYDTHVPLIFYGWNVPAQKVITPVYVIDIAPTISNLLGITEPSGCIGIPLLK